MKRVLPAGVKNCPRCGENYEDFPAMSRTDNKTEVCPPCGTAEALEDFLGTGAMPQADWVKNRAKVAIEFAGDVFDMRRAEVG